ncbi:MAG: redox-regulated ATPase YchF [Candidatus Puniceispirillum sp.]|nr:redox-regulated ATPase YchF [Candidatus Pelagibacter sp.]MBA4282691.1 redox-regulated ATPase YchF [Candidatus Puniceispirillum sp.]
MGFNCGIVGLPNIGKSTLFNALTSTSAAEAANYPFCTIDPNVGRVGVPDERLDKLASLAGSQKIIPTQLEFVDIAGLVKGASQGEGLGNQFLGHILSVDAIIHVLRCFEDDDITHVNGSVDPLRDLEIIETELLLADLASLQKRIPGLEKRSKQDPEAKEQFAMAQKILPQLENGMQLSKVKWTEEEIEILKKMNFLTFKPMLYVCNVSENDVNTGNEHTKKIESYAQQNFGMSVIISAAIEAEISQLSVSEQKEFLESLGMVQTGLANIVRAGYELLGLSTYFTVGPKEARAWTIKKGFKAPQAAGVIHTDFERGFICAETIAYADYVSCGGELQAKTAGKWRQEGKEYTVQDGDVINFRFNV